MSDCHGSWGLRLLRDHRHNRWFLPELARMHVLLRGCDLSEESPRHLEVGLSGTCFCPAGKWCPDRAAKVAWVCLDGRVGRTTSLKNQIRRRWTEGRAIRETSNASERTCRRLGWRRLGSEPVPAEFDSYLRALPPLFCSVLFYSVLADSKPCLSIACHRSFRQFQWGRWVLLLTEEAKGLIDKRTVLTSENVGFVGPLSLERGCLCLQTYLLVVFVEHFWRCVGFRFHSLIQWHQRQQSLN